MSHFSGLIEIAKDGEFDCVEIEEEGLKEKKQAVRDQIAEIWEVAHHAPRELEHYRQGFLQFWKLAYCVRWAKKKRIHIAWLDWAIAEEYLEAEDSQNDNTANEHKQIGEKKEENLVRLIGILRNMLKDEKVVSDLKRNPEFFKKSGDLTSYISGLYGEDRGNKGLSSTVLNEIWSDANKILVKDGEI